MKVIAELMIVPIGIGTSFSKYIAECERILKKTNLKVQLHAEGTNIEGDLDEVLQAVRECIEAMHQMNVPRLLTNLHLSTRTDKGETIEDKIKSVEEQM
ncbi:MTH1187 family thiamine-binding protein [Aquicella lusitana]|uniref:Uncharacterized protein (TIGR00106 family) n=1 Tax=Aquicella lusitana TaxID=254246 RepID=A0A370G5E4_9COXI|nr:MTH1187 family thiamine-binding protein [Aquicella lusitana]RDI39051.1 uncharacterized protein (TIGR00106 family) [Aquicella lusitana]VVC73658.1 hypothetical protein AQULUS_14050 [Aquicella lusitana]